MERGGTTDYYEADSLGSITSLTVGSGTGTQSYTYDSFGNTTNSSGSLTNFFRYASRRTETNFYYYRARYYDPAAGRFVSEDPIQFAGGSNFYRYARNNPILLIDPHGLGPTGTGIGGLVGGILGGIVGFGGGAVGGTFVLPGGGTIAGGWEGGAGGAAVGTVAGAYLGGVIGNAIESILNKSKAKPPCNERDDYCKDIYDADLEVCWSLPRKDQQAACARQAAIRYGECLAKGEPSSPLSWW